MHHCVMTDSLLSTIYSYIVDELIKFSEKKNDELKNQEVNFRTGYYSMNINVNYNVIIKRLNEIKSFNSF